MTAPCFKSPPKSPTSHLERSAAGRYDLSVRLLFVCLGNICRSPTAEAVFAAQAQDAGLEVEVDSAGTGSWHAGELADARMRKAASRRGIDITSRARQVTAEDFHDFDRIYVMDGSNMQDMLRIAPKSQRHKLELFRDYDPDGKGEDVPDPYYGGPQGFDEVIDICERTSRALLDKLQEDIGE